MKKSKNIHTIGCLSNRDIRLYLQKIFTLSRIDRLDEYNQIEITNIWEI